MKKPKIGDQVAVKEKVEAYYSDYGAHRGIKVFFMPGMTGVVGSVDVPCVRAPRGTNPVFHCVDFDATVKYNDHPDEKNPYRWRCAVKPNNLVVLGEKQRKR